MDFAWQILTSFLFSKLHVMDFALENMTQRSFFHHIVIQMKIRCYADLTPNVKIKYLYEKARYESMKEHLNCDWVTLLKDRNTEDKWEVFLDKLQEAITLYVPKKETKLSGTPRPRWINQETVRIVRKKTRAWKKWRDTNTPEAHATYARARNQARWATRKAVKQFEKRIASKVKVNPKLFWNYVNDKMKSRQPVSDLRKENGELTTNDEEKAQVLNDFFSSVFTREDQTNIPELIQREVPKPLTKVNFTAANIEKRLLKLKTSKSPGPDGLHPRILKELAKEISKPLKDIFTTSLREGKLLGDWRIAHITPIHKKGSKTEAGNYRPVSLTSILCKIMEGVIRDKVVNHMKENKLFSKDQHGFMNGRSTVTQLLETLEYWSMHLDSGLGVDAIYMYLDFQKAFDSVPHQRLLKKVRSYGVCDHVYKWIESFLKERRQRVTVNGAESNWAIVESGIPQGSVLGPILFIIFINDMPGETVCPLKLFADDAKLFHCVTSENDCKALQDDLDKLQEWANRWQLKFHPKKCIVLRVGRGHTEFSYYMWDGNKQVKLSEPETEKDLGVHIDKLLKFQHHITTIAKKGNQMAGLLWRTFEYIDEEMFMILYKTMVRSHLEYAAPVWSPHTWKLAEELEKVQRRATKRIPSLANLEYEERLRQLKLPTLVYRRLRGDMINVYKYLNKIYDTETCLLPQEKNDRTRGHQKKLRKQHTNTNPRHFFFTQRVAEWWNKLPQEVVSAPSVNTFKNRLDRHFDSHPMKHDYKALDNPVSPKMKIT